MEPVLLGIAVVGQDLLDKYELQSGNAILADPNKHLPLYEELVEKYKVEYIAGGATQNSIRAAQWMMQVPKGATHYIGCIGNDKFGTALKEAAEGAGVTTHYLVDETTATGTCAVLVKDKERSLVANLSAANNYKKEKHFDTPEIQELIKKVKVFYSASFFLTVSHETLLAIGKHAAENNKALLINLAAPFLIDYFWDQMSTVLPYADVVFSNEDEAAALGKKLGWGHDLDEIAKKLVEFPKENKNRKRIVIFTQGSKQTIVCTEAGVQKFHPVPIKPEDIVDTNGAGDSFVGGFLSRFVLDKPLEECVAAGHYCALECIKCSGASFPEKPNFTYP